MRTICDFVLYLISPPRKPRQLSEEDAIRALYFAGAAREVDHGLVERLLWWEGVEPPAPGEVARVRADGLAA